MPESLMNMIKQMKEFQRNENNSNPLILSSLLNCMNDFEEKFTTIINFKGHLTWI